MNRKKFIKKISTGILVGVPFIALTRCSESDDGDDTMDPSQGDCLGNGTSHTISANHGHTLIINPSDVSEGVEKTYTITGSATHPHTITVTASMFEQLKNNESISVGSSNDQSHSHSITISCVV
ncbi:MAG: hypothetical protein JXR07_13995 [Reichenbachiella sp.]